MEHAYTPISTHSTYRVSVNRKLDTVSLSPSVTERKGTAARAITNTPDMQLRVLKAATLVISRPIAKR